MQAPAQKPMSNGKSTDRDPRVEETETSMAGGFKAVTGMELRVFNEVGNSLK